jgi:DNA-binding LytR/AlgR family response regulator
VKLRALIVEDEWATRNYLVELLQASGGVDVVGAVATAEDARLALDATSADAGVDVAFVDVPFTEARVAQSLARIRERRAPRAHAAPTRFVARRKRALVFLRLDEVIAFESAERLTYVHTTRGRFDVDLSLSAIELSLGCAMLRVHRSWLVNADYVRELDGYGSETVLAVGADASSCVRVPVARERAQAVRDALLGNTMGIRAR